MVLAYMYKGLRKKSDGMRGCTDVAALVGLLAPGGSDAALEEAVSALAYLCSESIENKDSVRECGAPRRWSGCWRLAEQMPCMRVRGA